ncbi:MAG TPA: hypothetical protein VK864_05090 [Longimicrobiales bacterium]|nr:hypothetical protein [Longimicrobiales bacterium]
MQSDALALAAARKAARTCRRSRTSRSSIIDTTARSGCCFPGHFWR